MKPEWRDTTSYSQSEPRTQTVWTATVGPVEVTVMTSHIYFRPNWAYLISPLMREARALPGEIEPGDTDGAQRAALRRAVTQLKPYAEAYAALRDGVNS